MLICIISVLSTFSRGVKIPTRNVPDGYVARDGHDNIVYHLQLEGGNHYIGITSNLNRRWKQHATNKGSKWTKLHKPIKIVDVWHDATLELENKITYELMNKYGVTNVRGGDCHCPILKECKKFGCNYSDEISELDKIIGLLNKDWVREIISLEQTKILTQCPPHVYSVDKISNNIVKKNGNWYYNSDGDLYKITYEESRDILGNSHAPEKANCFRIICHYLLQIYKWENGTPWVHRLQHPDMYSHYMYKKMLMKDHH